MTNAAIHILATACQYTIALVGGGLIGTILARLLFTSAESGNRLGVIMFFCIAIFLTSGNVALSLAVKNLVLSAYGLTGPE